MEYREELQLQTMNRIGIMGGTFDPVHNGHLVTAEEARVEFNLDLVVFVPTGQPPHKRGLPISSKEHRYLMTVLATAANPFFEVSRIELDRPGETFTIDTVRQFKKKMAAKSELFFITGADAILEILAWKDVEELLFLSSFIAATRPGYDLDEMRGKLAKKLGKKNLERIKTLEVTAMAISSTEIRERVKSGKTIKYLLPEAVENFIIKNALYRDESLK